MVRGLLASVRLNRAYSGLFRPIPKWNWGTDTISSRWLDRRRGRLWAGSGECTDSDAFRFTRRMPDLQHPVYGCVGLPRFSGDELDSPNWPSWPWRTTMLSGTKPRSTPWPSEYG